MPTTFPVHRFAACGALACVLAAAGCSSDTGSSSNDRPGDARSALDRRADALAVVLSAPPSNDTYEIWSCLTGTGQPIGYTFFRDGTFDGAASSLRLGKELDPKSSGPPTSSSGTSGPRSPSRA